MKICPKVGLYGHILIKRLSRPKNVSASWKIDPMPNCYGKTNFCLRCWEVSKNKNIHLAARFHLIMNHNIWDFFSTHVCCWKVFRKQNKNILRWRLILGKKIPLFLFYTSILNWSCQHHLWHVCLILVDYSARQLHCNGQQGHVCWSLKQPLLLIFFLLQTFEAQIFYWKYSLLKCAPRQLLQEKNVKSCFPIIILNFYQLSGFILLLFALD